MEMTTADIVQIVIGILSLAATVAVSFLIYWLQTRHEKEIAKIEQDRQKRELEEKAHIFLLDNSNERDYLPCCIIAANLHRHETHSRAIYTNFCRCSPELQTEILKQAGFTLPVIKGREWVDICFSKLRDDIKEYKLGRDMLYGGAKYFHRGFEGYRQLPYKLDELHATSVYPNSTFTSATFVDNKDSFEKYLDAYFRQVFGEKDGAQNEAISYPPADYIWTLQKLGDADENIVCYWVMEFVEQVVFNIYSRKHPEGLMYDNMTDAAVETYEDMYYETLLWLYCTYYEESGSAE